jgi:hypothetical protein
MAKHAPNHSLRRVLALATSAAALLVLPASAHASFAKVDPTGKLVYTAAAGEANDLTVSYTSAGVVKLTEAGRFGPFPILIGGSGGCSGLAALVACSGASSLELKMGDGDDRVAARNGNMDKISCGSGTDAVAADSQDSVAADCESVDRPAALAPSDGGSSTTTDPATGTTTTTSPPVDAGRSELGEASPFVNITPPQIPSQTVTVTRSGIARVQIVCPADAGACRGTVDLLAGAAAESAHAKMVAAARRRKMAKLGHAKFKAVAGEKPFVQVRLNRRGRRRILRTRHTRCRVVVTTRSAAGKVVTTTQSITLRPRRTASRGKRP